MSLTVSDDVRSLVKEYHPFYEVLPYYVVLEERHAGLPATAQRVQAGFDVDIYGVRTKNDGPVMPPPEKYGLGYATLKKVAEIVSQNAAGSCSLEVIPLPSTVVFDFRDRDKVETMFRIRVSHCRGLDQPAGLPEQHALEEVQKELKAVGVARR